MTTSIFNFCGVYVAFMRVKGKSGGWFLKSRDRQDLLNKCISIYYLNKNEE